MRNQKIILGITGTRNGLTPLQRTAFRNWIIGQAMLGNDIREVHHGACVGADEQMIREIDDVYNEATFVAHLASGGASNLASEFAKTISVVVHDPEPPLERNWSIVRECTLLLACPATMEEEMRSGTWATVRYARKAGKPIVIVWSDGTITREG